MNPSIKQIAAVPLEDVREREWKELLQKPYTDRHEEQVREDTLYIGQLIISILGVYEDEDEYMNELYDLANDEDLKLEVLSETLDKQIENKAFQDLQEIWRINQQEQLSVNRLVAFLDGKQLLPKLSDSLMNRHIRIQLIEVLKQFQRVHEKGLQDGDFRRVLFDLVKFSLNHLEPWLESNSEEGLFPRVLWYGEATKSQSYFLYFLYLIGADLIFYHPNKEDIFSHVNLEVDYSLVETLPQQQEPTSFPTERKKRSATVAYKASQEMDRVLHHDNSMLYKPWQFRQYAPMSITMKTTYDEIFILGKEKAFVRPQFYVEDGVVHIPSLFAKVVGVSNNRDEYWSRMQQMADYNPSHVVNEFPFSEEVKGNYRFHYTHSLNTDGTLQAEKMMSGNFWRYKQLPNGLQTGIAKAIERMCSNPQLYPLPGESEEDVKIYLFQQATQLPTEFLQLLQKFDYAQEVPKLVLYNNELNGEMSRADAARLLLMNEVGVDLLLYNPSGHNDLESYLNEERFDTHMLEEMCFGLDYKESYGLKDRLRSKIKRFLGE
ncbi:hypothetical protein N781_06400 [Pontibacillus halophilus JSM 076056 = DSM 19796]|uniref:Putative component of 'biosynthetic module' domain-containing protein n=1 Tax=Pontibacillus halophilus JSM 076056 = DSM 19796 TaxID=1385510 RepID=A0A0A5GFB5_9BACI|nr:YceG family protein [Pontibacillus halophilus]KGX90694.1 hypothetical protein N781_06400 [Pontibacillus halophilus JSM 076056 = DSM 19796]